MYSGTVHQILDETLPALTVLHMLLTEDDAKTKECRVQPPVMAQPPMAAGPGTVLMTVGSTLPRALPCSASSCMAWRWGTPLYRYVDGDGPNPGEGWTRVQYTGFPSGFAYRQHIEDRGFCGLAGPPR